MSRALKLEAALFFSATVLKSMGSRVLVESAQLWALMHNNDRQRGGGESIQSSGRNARPPLRRIMFAFKFEIEDEFHYVFGINSIESPFNIV